MEQDAAILDTLVRVLELEGFVVERGASLQEGREVVQREVVDVIVVGEEFPDGNGLEFVATMRGLGFTAPILLMRTVGPGGFSLKAAEAGATAVLSKPFTLDELRLEIYRAIDATTAEFLAPAPAWGQLAKGRGDSPRSLAWMVLLCSLLMGLALVATFWAMGM